MPWKSPRPTAGRKRLYESGMVKKEVWLPPDLLTVAGTLGNGNVSAGIRAALAMAAPSVIPQREVQVWRWCDGFYVVIWQEAMVAAAGPMSQADAEAMRSGAVPLPEQWQPETADALDEAFWRGETERADGGENAASWL